ncbi:MAG TPA: sigma-70 family RNA polymerase sigma factor [Terriglobales bacterium]|nr:sigma-70 family RNA polymerase sigma factor [Terriglobales bacterium]
MAGAATLGNLAGALELRAEESSIVAELKAGSEDAYAWLISQYQAPVYNLIYRMLNDTADAADTTQEVFLKVFRGMKHFNGASSLKTWIYRIAVHEASNRRRWWFRHQSRETSMEVESAGDSDDHGSCLKEILVDERTSPFDDLARTEMRARVEDALHQVAEPYRTTLVLRDMEELSYEEIAEVMEVSLGTVKSRLTRGRDALKKKLERFLQTSPSKLPSRSAREAVGRSGREIEVTS